MQNEILSRIWYEKYRPKSLEQLQLKPIVKQKMEEILKNPKQNLAHLLFVGLPGSGKTTLAKILISHIIRSPRDLLELNGSGLGIDDVRDTIEPFTRTPPLASPVKIIFIDEFDNASKDFYLAFRKLIEQAAKHVSVIATANYIRKIPSPIQSRFQIFYFNALPKDKVLEYVFSVLDAEQVEYNKEDVIKIVNYYYPKVRDILQTLQKYTVNKKLQLEDHELVDVNNKVISYFNQILAGNATKQTLNEIAKLLRTYHNMLDLKFIIDSIMELADLDQKLIIADYAYKIESSIYPDVILIALAFKLWKSQ